MMRILTLFALFLAVGGQAYAAEPSKVASGNKKEIIKKVESRMAYIKNLTADFKQSFFDASMGEVEESTGRVFIQKPLKMRWEYIEPAKQTIISDGESFYFYVPRDKQVMVEPLGRLLDSRSPALFLAGNKKLAELFHIELEPTSNKYRIGDIRLRLRPREKSLMVTRIVVSVDKTDFTIRSFTLFDWAGNRTEIEFLNMDINVKIDNEKFIFIKPKGVERMEIPRFILKESK